jgi:hypothetical protein
MGVSWSLFFHDDGKAELKHVYKRRELILRFLALAVLHQARLRRRATILKSIRKMPARVKTILYVRVIFLNLCVLPR